MQNEITKRTWSRQKTSNPIELSKRFWIRVKIGEPSECWLWMGAKWNHGYGKLDHDGRVVCAHRMAFKLSYGFIDDCLDVCHRCDNPPCCNPLHLFLGSAKENIDDAIRKGRFHKARGCKHGKAKLTEEQAKIILSDLDYALKHRPQLAKRFNVSYNCINNVIHGNSWSWLNRLMP